LLILGPDNRVHIVGSYVFDNPKPLFNAASSAITMVYLENSCYSYSIKGEKCFQR